MSRTLGDKFLRNLSYSNPNSLGVRLAKICVEANLPASYVAYALDSSRMTVYSWFRGKGVSEKKRDTVEAFIKLVTDDLSNNVLPVKTNAEAKSYIENMLGGLKI